MSAGITSRCTPCAAAPVAPQKPSTADGGGNVQPPATKAAPAATGYDHAVEPAACGGGRWVPAPSTAAGGDTPPEPVATDSAAPAPDASAAGGPIEGGPASALPNWPTWQQYFTDLGVSQDELATIASAPLDDHGLAEVYKDLHTGIVASGGVPGETDPASVDPAVLTDPAATTGGASATAAAGTSAWTPEWEQRFLDLGVPAGFVDMLKEQATATGADDAKLASVYDELATVKAGAASAASSPMGVDPATGMPATGAVDPAAAQAEAAAAAAQQPGWSPEIEQAFSKLGMPKEIVKIYAESGAPIGGLEAAYKHAAGRVQDFTDRGWMDKFEAEGVDPMQTWSLILGEEPVSDEDAQAQLDAAKNASMGMPAKGLQFATSLFPGGRLAQYVMGKEAVSGESIDRSDPLEIGFAALSGVAAFAAFRGAKNMSSAFAARSGGYAALNSVDETMKTLMPGMPKTGADAMEQAALGATETWGAKQKLMAALPFTSLHKEVMGLGHAEAAARAFNAGGAAKLMETPDGALQVSTLGQMFRDLHSGATTFEGGKNAYLGQIKRSAPMSLAAGEGGTDVVRVAKGLGIGDGRSQLASMLEVGGQKLGANPEWLRTAPSLSDDIAARSNAELDVLGKVMAGNAASELGIGSDGIRAVRYLQNLQQSGMSPWYTEMAERAAGQAPASGSRSLVTELDEAFHGPAIGGTTDQMLARATATQEVRSAGVERAVDRAIENMRAKTPAVENPAAEAAASITPARPTTAPVKLVANAAGEVTTPSGVIVPSYASPVSGTVGGATMDEAQELSAMMNKIQAGSWS